MTAISALTVRMDDTQQTPVSGPTCTQHERRVTTSDPLRSNRGDSDLSARDNSSDDHLSGGGIHNHSPCEMGAGEDDSDIIRVAAKNQRLSNVQGTSQLASAPPSNKRIDPYWIAFDCSKTDNGW